MPITNQTSKDEIKEILESKNQEELENKEEVENLVLENTNESVDKMKNLFEQTLGIDMGSIAPQLSEEETVIIGESINEFLDKLIATGGEVEIYFG